MVERAFVREIFDNLETCLNDTECGARINRRKFD
jgi:hypothetical protein